MERSVLSGSVILPGTTQLPKLAFSVPRRQSRKSAVPRVSASTQSSNGKDRIYIGKGKYVMDDAKKYPKKENAGDLLQGISGGWAGGEIGLKAFTAENGPEDVPSTKSSKSKKAADGVKTTFAGKDVVAKKMGEGADTLYVGFSPGSMDDLMARKEGAMGKFIVDDAKKYPSKDNYVIGDLAGGFAGGEKGVKQFVEKGEIEFIDPSQSRQWSPIVIATLVAGVGSFGAILLSNVFDLSEGIINQDVLNTAMDDKTKLLFEVAIVLLGVTWIGSTTFATFKALREKLSMGTQGATNVLITVGFWTVVLVVAYRISQT
ncbi:hypothetical protein BSKO_12783 [Bryopsis sp. KO-2023]|nr:hypothetical protein BSKO_12783 [Bryopsis sp. KO-2023]